MKTVTSWATGSTRYLRDQDAGTGQAATQTAQQTQIQAPLGANGAQEPKQMPQPPVKPQTNGDQDQPPEGMRTLANGSVQVLSPGAYKRLKEEQRAKGQKEALSNLAKEMGFSSIEEMKTWRKGQTSAQQPQRKQAQRQAPVETDTDDELPDVEQQAQPKNTKTERRDQARFEKERMKLERDRQQLQQRLVAESRARKELQQQLDANEAEASLREVAVMAGVRDLDYATRLLQRHLAGKDDAELAAFDESKWFEGLRTTHPYLFGEVTKPATTGTGVGNAPQTQQPGVTAQQQANGNQVDARKMSREEFAEHLKKRGLSASF